MAQVYGIDTDKEVTPIMVRDALVNCFIKAHCEDTGVDEVEGDVNREYCKSIVSKGFEETGGDFENPTKEDILNVMTNLMEFSRSFRDPEIIKKHAAEMTQLVEKMK